MSEKKNYHTIRYGTAEGEIKFGHVHTDNVNSAVMLRSGHTFQHYMTMVLVVKILGHIAQPLEDQDLSKLNMVRVFLMNNQESTWMQ